MAGECWPVSEDGQGEGEGGGPLIPGSGGYGSVPPEAQATGSPPPPGCKIVPATACHQKCLDIYEDAAAKCARMENEPQRKTCGDAAHATYTSCRESCQEIEGCRQDCEAKAEACEAECRKLPEDDKAGRQKCWKGCNDAYAECIKKCKD